MPHVPEDALEPDPTPDASDLTPDFEDAPPVVVKSPPPSLPRDWRLTIVMVLAFVTIAVVGFTAPYVVSTGSTTREIRDSGELSSCRSAANANKEKAQTRFTLAIEARDKLDSELASLQNEQITSALDRNIESYRAVVAQIGPKREALANSQLEVDAAAGALERATAAYEDATDLARSDPSAFLSQCREDP